MSEKPLSVTMILTGAGLDSTEGGSLTRIVQVSKRLMRQAKIIFVATEGSAETCRRNGIVDGVFLARSSFIKKRETSKVDRIVSYLVCTLSSILVVIRLPKADIVYTESDGFFDLIPAVVFKVVRGAKLVVTSHHMIHFRTDNSRYGIAVLPTLIAQRLSYIIMRVFADRIQVLNSPAGMEIAQYFIRQGVLPSGIKFVSNGVDARKIQNIKYGADSGFDACAVGVLRPNKGLYDIVSIWSEVCKKSDNAKLAIIGSTFPGYLGSIKRDIKLAGLSSNIILRGYVAWDSMIQTIKSSKVFLNPSYEEGWGIAVSEALACGTPVVAYRLPAYSVFGGAISEVELGNKREFAARTIRIMSDSTLRGLLAEEGRKIAEELDWEEISQLELASLVDLKRGAQ